MLVLQVAAILMKSHIRKTLPLRLGCPYLAPRIWVSGSWVPMGAHTCKVTHIPLVESRVKCRQTVHCQQCQPSPAHVVPATEPSAPAAVLHTPRSRVPASL